MAKKITDFKIDTTVEFNFLGTEYKGTVIGHESKENAIRVTSNKKNIFGLFDRKGFKILFSQKYLVDL